MVEVSEMSAMIDATELAGESKLSNGAENTAHTYAFNRLKTVSKKSNRKQIRDSLKEDSVFIALKSQIAAGINKNGDFIVTNPNFIGDNKSIWD